MRKAQWGLGALGLAVALFAFGPAHAQSQKNQLGFELNKVETNAEGCQIHFVINNRSAANITELSVDMAAFDTGGTLLSAGVISFGRIPAERTQLRSLVFTGTDCVDIGHLLINDFVKCEIDGGADFDCGDALEVRSRARVGLIR